MPHSAKYDVIPPNAGYDDMKIWQKNFSTPIYLYILPFICRNELNIFNSLLVFFFCYLDFVFLGSRGKAVNLISA